jgi:hypothetical protein
MYWNQKLFNFKIVFSYSPAEKVLTETHKINAVLVYSYKYTVEDGLLVMVLHIFIAFI